MNYRKIKGTNDYLPDESTLFRGVKNIIENVIRSYGFKYEITPILEPHELFIRSIGENTDIVNKEMFVFTSKSNKQIALKPEETAVLYRSISENNFINDNDLRKLFYFTPVFRYERPQKGRYREFYQFGVEIINSYDARRDAEIMELGSILLKALNIENTKLHINSIGCSKCRPEYRSTLKTYLHSVENKLCENCGNRIDVNPLRVLDCKNPQCINAVKDAPVTTDHLCSECADHFETVQHALERMGIEYTVNPRIVRGLDYYSKTVFEFIEEGDNLGAQSTIIGGGRYDYLGNEFGMENLGAVGFAGGFERLMMSVPQQMRDAILRSDRIDIAAVYMDDKSEQFVEKLIRDLREAGIICEIAYENDSMKRKMKFAARTGAEFSLICGENEIESNTVTLKHMKTGKQTTVDADVSKIKEVIND